MIKTLISMSLLVFVTGCSSVNNTLLIPKYNEKKSELEIDTYILENVSSLKKNKIDRKAEYIKNFGEKALQKFKGIENNFKNVDEYEYEVILNNEKCYKINYHHVKSKNINTLVDNASISNTIINNNYERFGNIYFISETDNKKFTNLIYTKNKMKEYIYILTEKKCFDEIKNYFKEKSQ